MVREVVVSCGPPHCVGNLTNLAEGVDALDEHEVDDDPAEQ